MEWDGLGRCCKLRLWTALPQTHPSPSKHVVATISATVRFRRGGQASLEYELPAPVASAPLRLERCLRSDVHIGPRYQWLSGLQCGTMSIHRIQTGPSASRTYAEVCRAQRGGLHSALGHSYAGPVMWRVRYVHSWLQRETPNPLPVC
jgi:hypothetical protein